jgi:hypothetical protein
MNTGIEVKHPLDVIQFVSGNKKLYIFLEYLFRKAAEFNEENEEQMGENFFPVCSYNSMARSYDFEYEFLVETYINFAKDIYDISDDDSGLMLRYLYSSNDKKIMKARYLFFVGVFGYYFRLGNGYYNDLSKNYGMIYFEKLVMNKHNVVAKSRMVMVRDFIEEHLSESARYNDLKMAKIEQVAYGKNQIKKYIEENGLGEVPKIYDLSKL